jgi:hypothetical protein
MEESALDYDSLSGLIRSTLKRMDPDELSEIYSLLKTGKLQHMILEILGVDETECNPDELGSMTVMLQTALRQILENNGA